MEIEKVEKAVKLLEKSSEFAAIIPEVRSNIVMAVENAEVIEQVVGIPGRITTVNGRAKAFMAPDFMNSSHMARLVLAIMKHDPSKRSALNMKYEPAILEICEKLGLKVSCYNRAHEPVKVKEIEGGTIPWGVETAIKMAGTVPDVIYHTGAWGKEPMICLVGSDAVEVAEMAVCIAKLFDTRKNKKVKTPEKLVEHFDNCQEVIFSPSRGIWKEQKTSISCIFCAIAEFNPDIEERVLYNDQENMVLMNIFPYSRGHLVVVPVKHYTDLNDLSSEEVKNIIQLGSKVNIINKGCYKT